MVKSKLLHSQEIEVFYVLPALRKHLAMQMKANGLKQNEIAKLLGIEDAAVSQYLSNKRGDKIKFDSFILKEIAKSAKKVKDSFTLLEEMQRLLVLIRTTGALCRLHRSLSNVPLACSANNESCHHGGGN